MQGSQPGARERLVGSGRRDCLDELKLAFIKLPGHGRSQAMIPWLPVGRMKKANKYSLKSLVHAHWGPMTNQGLPGGHHTGRETVQLGTGGSKPRRSGGSLESL